MRAARRARSTAVRSRGEQGASAVEYALVVSLIAAVLVIGLFALGRIVGDSFGSLDCWTSTGGSGCSAVETVPSADTDPAEPVAVVAEPTAPLAPTSPAAPAGTVQPEEKCNQSGNGNGKGQGQGNCP